VASITDFINRKRGDTPLEEIGIGGFTTLARVRERYALTAEIPDVPVEDGTSISDHIIHKPKILTIEGDVSDIHLKPSPIIREFQRAQAEIGNLVSQFAPSRTQAQLSKINALATDIDAAIKKGQAVIDAGGQALDYLGLRDSKTKTIQEQFIDAIEALYYGDQLIAIDMPFRQHKNMVITSFTADYDNQENATTFSITAQEMVLAETVTTEVETPADGTDGQTKDIVNKGTQTGESTSQSFLFSALGRS